MKHILITGVAGFIGSHLAEDLLSQGFQVTGIDNFDSCYSRSVKEQNIRQALQHPSFRFVECDIRDFDSLGKALPASCECIVHLAARAGVRPSIEDPFSHQEVNVLGTQNLLELARLRGIRQIVFASSSSVYGVNPNVPWRESDPVLLPISPYAATKIAGELLGHVYSHLYGIRFIALRFFTVFGPRQRPDLAIHKFTRLIREGKPIPMFGDGSTRRDYTFVADVTRGVRLAIDYRESFYEVFNIASGRPVSLRELVDALQAELQVNAAIDFRPVQPGDVPQTFADTTKAAELLSFRSRISLTEGLYRFAKWYEDAGC